MDYIMGILPAILEGLLGSLKIFSISLVLSLPLGLLLALIREREIIFLEKLIEGFVLIMRGTPLMLQLVFIFFALPIVNINLDRYSSAIIAFVLNYGAYFAEIFRGGLLAIDKGQYEASQVLGFSKIQMYRRIIFPQLIGIVLPSLSNEIISLLKDTSLVYVVGIGELLRAAKIASNRDASLLPLLLAGIIYLLLIGLITVIMTSLEERYSYES